MGQAVMRQRPPAEVAGGGCWKWCRQETYSPAVDMMSGEGMHYGWCQREADGLVE